MRFLSRQMVCICLNNISIESSWFIDYKYVIFSLAQIRAYILRGMKLVTQLLYTAKIAILILRKKILVLHGRI